MSWIHSSCTGFISALPHLPLSLSAAHHGPRAAHRRPENGSNTYQKSPLSGRSTLLGKDLRRQLRHRRRHRHPHGVSVRHQLVLLRPRHRRSHRPASRHGRRLLLLPRVQLPRPLPLRRKASLRLGSLGSGLHGLPRLLALRLLHHRHQRLDAAPRRLPDPAQRRLRDHQLLGTAA